MNDEFDKAMRQFADGITSNEEGRAMYEAALIIERAMGTTVAEYQTAWEDLTDDQRTFWIQTATNIGAAP